MCIYLLFLNNIVINTFDPFFFFGCCFVCHFVAMVHCIIGKLEVSIAIKDDLVLWKVART